MDDFGLLLLIIVLIILLIINAKYNNNKSQHLKNVSQDDSSLSSMSARNRKMELARRRALASRFSSSSEEASSKFQPKLIIKPDESSKKGKSGSINKNKVYDLSIASSGTGSSVTCTKDSDDELKPPHQGKDYYYLGDPKETQLYHIFKNVYTFEDAKEECVKRSSTLANPEQLVNAYTSGANWCSWGWTSDGNAYLPSKTTKCNKDTGLLNGKNIDPYLRLGVNCFGVPKESPSGLGSDDSDLSEDTEKTEDSNQ